MSIPSKVTEVVVGMPRLETWRDRETLAMRAAPLEWRKVEEGGAVVWAAEKRVPSRWRDGGDVYEIGQVAQDGAWVYAVASRYLFQGERRPMRQVDSVDDGKAWIEQMAQSARLPEVSVSLFREGER